MRLDVNLDAPPSSIESMAGVNGPHVVSGGLIYNENMIKSIKHGHNQNAYAFDPNYENRSWFQTIADSSHLITFFISIVVIVYGSFKSLNLDKKFNECQGDANSYTGKGETQKLFSQNGDINQTDDQNDDEDDDDDDENGLFSKHSCDRDGVDSVQTIDSVQALFIPVVASLSLLFMFFFFDSIQTVFVICTSILATTAFYYLLTPVCQYLLKLIFSNSDFIKKRKNCCFFGRYKVSELMSFFLSSTLVFLWILTGHWILMDIIGIGFCVTFIAIVRLPSLKVSTLLLVGLVIYDVVWVYFSHLIFSSNVMVKVATKEADNPVGLLAKKFNIELNDSPKLSLPGKLVVPSYQRSGNFSILGLGDIVVPGLLLCFVLRFDAYKRNQLYRVLITTDAKSTDSSAGEVQQNCADPKQPRRIDCKCLNCKLNDFKSSTDHRNDSESSRSTKYRFHRFLSYPFIANKLAGGRSGDYNNENADQQFNYSIRNLIKLNRISYFHCSLIGYFVGLLTATLSSEIFREAQPALLFLVPFTLLPLLIMAYMKGDLQLMWNEPFNNKPSNYFFV